MNDLVKIAGLDLETEEIKPIVWRAEDNKDLNWHKNTYVDLGNLGTVELVDFMGTDLTISNSARVSYGKRKTKLDEKDEKLIKFLIKHNHVSTLEHCVMTFMVRCPKPINVQWLRHRSQAFNEISGRYVEFEDDFYIPEVFREQSKDSKQASEKSVLFDKDYLAGFFEGLYTSAHEKYKKLIDLGLAKEQARMAMPFGFMTEFYVTMNLRSFLHWYRARVDKHSQWEIQQFAKASLHLVKDLYPVATKTFMEVQDEYNSIQELQTENLDLQTELKKAQTAIKKLEDEKYRITEIENS